MGFFGPLPRRHGLDEQRVEAAILEGESAIHGLKYTDTFGPAAGTRGGPNLIHRDRRTSV